MAGPACTQKEPRNSAISLVSNRPALDTHTHDFMLAHSLPTPPCPPLPSKLAFPHVHCGENGDVTGFPFWSGEHAYGSRAAAGRMAALSHPDAAVAIVAPAAAVAPRGRKKKKILAAAHLPNEERDRLHLEMHRYLQWLHGALSSKAAATAAEGEAAAAPGNKKRRSGNTVAGVNLSALHQLTEAMEATFRVVRNAKKTPADPADTLPFLEEALGEHLGDIVDAVRKDPEAKPAARPKRNGGLVLNFEDMYERLVQFQQTHGHVNVAQKYADDGQLGSWVANIRSKRKSMAKNGEEFEPDVDDADDNENGEDEDAGDEGGAAGGGGKRRKLMGGRQRLTRERIDRLDTLGFQWVVANPNQKSWEERFEDLKEYQQIHGTTRVPRSSGTLGEWVHMQRRLHNKKDPKFLARRAVQLDDIGFEWHPRKHALVSWEDNFNRLIEFGRVNRHYNTQSPFPEGYLGDEGEQDAELVEAHRFHKWVRRIHAEYRVYASGKVSRMLNDARVMQLREIGFQFIL